MESQQLLEIIPSNSIKFEGTFKEVITKKLLIKNPSDKHFTFKIKTTTPKQYCVRPSIGYVSPQQTREISIILQPMQYTINEKAKHKFMIQSLVIAEEDLNNIDLVWKNAIPTSIMCTKLLSVLVYTPEPVNETPVQAETNILATPDLISTIESTESSIENSVNAISVMGDLGMMESNKIEDDPLDKLSEENTKLKEQVVTLKKLVFDQTYKLESMQVDNNFDKDKLIKDDLVAATPTTSQLGLPLITYQLLAFFLGLIIGKFFL